MLLPMPGRCFESFELFDEGQQTRLLAKFGRHINMLMSKQETNVLLGRHRGDLPAKAFERVTMNPRKQPAIAPFQLGCSTELAAENGPLILQSDQRKLDIGAFDTKK